MDLSRLLDRNSTLFFMNPIPDLGNIEQIYCRICLQSQPKSSLLSPCQCRGSTQHVHEPCLMEWATKNNKPRQNPTTKQYQLQCQICKFSIPLLRQQHHQIRSCQREERFKFVIEITSIVCLIFCFFFILRKHYDYMITRDAFLIYITLALSIFIGIGVLVLIGCTMYTYGWQVEEVYTVNPNPIPANDGGSAIQMNNEMVKPIPN